MSTAVKSAFVSQPGGGVADIRHMLKHVLSFLQASICAQQLVPRHASQGPLPVERPLSQMPVAVEHSQEHFAFSHVSAIPNAAFVLQPVVVPPLTQAVHVVSAAHVVNSAQQSAPRQSPHAGAFASTKPLVQMAPVPPAPLPVLPVVALPPEHCANCAAHAPIAA